MMRVNREFRVIHPRSIWSTILPVSALAILLTSYTLGQTTTDPAQNAAAPAQIGQQTNPADAPPDNSEPKPPPQRQPEPLRPEAQHEKAAQELKQQEQQRMLGVIPDFNTTDVHDAVPLTPNQKFHLAFRSSIDPFQFVAAALDAGIGQAANNFAGYGQGAQGYSKRFGAAYADQFSGLFWANALFPTLLQEDPRYFRQRTGSVKHRLLYAISSIVWTKHDNGAWGPNYANVLGNITAGGLANLYYPSADRSIGLTFQRALTITTEGTLFVVFSEFWPDIRDRLSHQHRNNPPATEAAPK